MRLDGEDSQSTSEDINMTQEGSSFLREQTIYLYE